MFAYLLFVNDSSGITLTYWGNVIWAWAMIQGSYSLSVSLTTEYGANANSYFKAIYTGMKNFFFSVIALFLAAMLCGLPQTLNSFRNSGWLWCLQYLSPIAFSVAVGTYQGFRKNRQRKLELLIAEERLSAKQGSDPALHSE